MNIISYEMHLVHYPAKFKDGGFEILLNSQSAIRSLKKTIIKKKDIRVPINISNYKK